MRITSPSRESAAMIAKTLWTRGHIFNDQEVMWENCYKTAPTKVIPWGGLWKNEVNECEISLNQLDIAYRWYELYLIYVKRIQSDNGDKKSTERQHFTRIYNDCEYIFYHDVGEIWWPQPIRLLKMGHVTGQGSTTTTWVGRVSDLGKSSFHKMCKKN